MENRLNELTKFVCTTECKLSGRRNSILSGEIVYARVLTWRTCTFLDIYGSDDTLDSIGLGKSYNFVPFYKWRERQIDSILYD